MSWKTTYPAAALFDFDGTIVDREPLMLEALTDVLRGAGRVVTYDDLARFTGCAWTDVYQQLALSSQLDWTFSEFMDRVLAAGEVLLANGRECRVLTGAVELIERLGQRGLPVGVVTGSLRREVMPVLEQLGVSESLTLVLSADDYGRGKPDPECYLRAAAVCGVRPSGCLVFEDSDVGIAAANAAGMKVVAVREANAPIGHPAHQRLDGAHVVVDTLAEVDDDLLGAIFGLSG
ncbi:MAG: HAD family phosphatase [Acidimicrobiales bacterium]|nr:HAD family phosphatase [Acidimicrobiales bacterium]